MSKPGYVYFIVDSETRRVKIGYSTEPERRLKELMTGYPGKLTIAKTIPGRMQDERKYHKVFCHSKLCREWFVLSPEIEAFLER